MGVNWQVYKKSQNSTWLDNEGRPFNIQKIKGKNLMGRIFSQRKQKMKRRHVRECELSFAFLPFPYEIFSLYKEYKKDPVRTNTGKFYSVTKKKW